MKKLMLSLMFAAIATLAFAQEKDNITSIDINTKAPMTDVKMLDVSGENVSLKDAAKENGLLVIFSCNTCPFVINWEDRYLELMKIAAQHNIGLIFINSNEAFRGDEDAYEAMQKHYKEKGYHSSYYVVDKDHQVADAFGARTTPHVFLFNNDMSLVFKGAIDDNNKDATQVEEHYLKDAIFNLINRKEINPHTTKNLGCSIKRVKS